MVASEPRSQQSNKIDQDLLVINKQRQFFNEGHTLSIAYRRNQLKKLRAVIEKNEAAIFDALKADLHKPVFEAFGTELGIVYAEIDEHLYNLDKWSKPQSVGTGFFHFKASSKIYKEPLGQVLIISPWNYPFQLTINPLVGAISAGNVVVIKPSEISAHTSAIMAKIVRECFDEQYVYLIQGDKAIVDKLLTHKWDLIFFTGSTAVGKIIYEAAASKLTPVILELGGKSPCIVHEDAHLENSAKRIAWGKIINAGQTCVAPDYLYVHKDIKDKLLARIQYHITSMLGEQEELSNDYGRIVSERHYLRIVNLMKDGNILFGGKTDSSKRFISPTLITDVELSDTIMQEEIFGPLLPIITYTSIDEVISFINKRPKPLALYVFTSSNKIADEVIRRVPAGGGCINDVLWHLGNKNLSFGGVGDSGMGHYHGKFSYDSFSHSKSILNRSNLIDLPLRYPPYDKLELPILKKLFKYFG